MSYFTAKQNGVYEFAFEITNTPLEFLDIDSIKEIISGIGTNFNNYDCEIISELTDEIKDFIKESQEKLIKDMAVFENYFEGMSYIGDPEIQTIGRNKFDDKLILNSLNTYTGEEQPYRSSELRFTRWYRFKMWLLGKNKVEIETSNGRTTKTYSNLYKGILFIYKIEVTEEANE